MIDQVFQRAAEWIQSKISQDGLDYLTDLITLNAFQNMTVQEIQIECIELALKALTLAFLFWVINRIRKASQKKKEKTVTDHSTGKPFKPKKWKTDGSYYDEDKKQWIDPDYK